MTRDENSDLAARHELGAIGDWLPSTPKQPQWGSSVKSETGDDDPPARGHLLVDDIAAAAHGHELFRNVSFEAMPGTTTFIYYLLAHIRFSSSFVL